MSTPEAAASLRFGRFELQPGERRLLVDGAPAPLGGRAFDLLLALAERPGQLVGKHALMDLVWPGLVVQENNLAAQINLEFIARRHRGDTNRLTLAWLRETHPKLLARYERWADVVSYSGPVDETTFLYHTGRMYLSTGNPHQALEAFARSTELAQDWVAPKLAQAQCQNLLGNYVAVLALTDEASIPPAHPDGQLQATGLPARATAVWKTGQTNPAQTLRN